MEKWKANLYIYFFSNSFMLWLFLTEKWNWVVLFWPLLREEKQWKQCYLKIFTIFNTSQQTKICFYLLLKKVFFFFKLIPKIWWLYLYYCDCYWVKSFKISSHICKKNLLISEYDLSNVLFSIFFILDHYIINNA